MVNDITTLNGALSELGETMTGNLNDMGVLSADPNDGLTTLAGKILDIEPSIGGLDLDTAVSIHSTDDTCLVGQSIMFWAELTASYDDETPSDVDLTGVLTGATVTFKSGNTVLGTGVTDNDGVAYYTHTFTSVGEYNITAVFEGTSNFDACTSTAKSITVLYTLDVTADKSVLSYADGDVATITATLEDDDGGVSGETLSYEILDKNDNVLDSGTDTTDSNGEISFTYASTGIGDIQVVVYYGILLTETYAIEDCYDTILGLTDEILKFGNSIGLRNSGTGAMTYDSSNQYYRWVVTKNNSESFVPISSATGHDDFIIEFDSFLTTSSGLSGNGITLYHDANNWCRMSSEAQISVVAKNVNGSFTENQTNQSSIYNKWVHFKYTFTNDTVVKEITDGDTSVISVTENLSSSWFDNSTKYGFMILWGTSWNNNSYVKNIKVKAL